MKKITVLYLILVLAGLFAACDRNEDPIYDKLSDNRFPVIFANTNFVTPAIPAGGVVKGTALKIEFNFVKTDPIKEIQFFEKLGTADSILISRSDYAPAFSASKGCDTLIYNYVVPSAPAAGTSVVFRGRVVNVNGLTKDRTFTYLIK